MPCKTNVNNLTIVWQGQSWSVIAPNGIVLARFKEKNEGKLFAQNIKEYISSHYPEFTEDDFYEKLKNPSNTESGSNGNLHSEEIEKVKAYSVKKLADFELYKRRVELIKYMVAVPLIIISGMIVVVGVVVSLINILVDLVTVGLSSSLLILTRSLFTLLLPFEAFVFGFWYFDQYKPNLSSQFLTPANRKYFLQFAVALPISIFTGIALVVGVIVGVGHFFYLLLTISSQSAFNFLVYVFLWCIVSLILFLGAVRYLEDY